MIAVSAFMNLTVVSIACCFYFVKHLFYNLYFLFVFLLFNYFVFLFLLFSFINNLFIVFNGATAPAYLNFTTLPVRLFVLLDALRARKRKALLCTAGL